MSLVACIWSELYLLRTRDIFIHLPTVGHPIIIYFESNSTKNFRIRLIDNNAVQESIPRFVYHYHLLIYICKDFG